ncbi:MAG TPA: hypothetical protein VMG31_06635 [Verrucomicrobiae bacterium]|nr:hypothetical protein [Verrucomicrobiae bacterium]
MRTVRQFVSRWREAILARSIRTRPKIGVTYPANPPASRAWRALYLAAVFETDEKRMVQRIAEARKALVTRARDLFHTAGDHLQEENAIEETLQSLHVLEQCAIHPPPAEPFSPVGMRGGGRDSRPCGHP